MILFNNEFVARQDAKVDIEDRGYQFGDGVYEVIRVYNRNLMYLEEHLQRFKRSMTALRINAVIGKEELANKLKKLVELNDLDNGIIYMQITRGVSTRNHAFPDQVSGVITAYTKDMERPMETMRSGISAHLLEDFRWLRCDIKSLNLLGNVLAKQEALEHNCKETIFYRDKNVTEGSSSNVFIIQSNTLYTHPATNLILNGITRLSIIDFAIEIGLPVVEKPFTVDQLLTADEVFITSTTQEITPVVSVSSKPISNGKPGKWTQQLQEAFSNEIKKLN